MTTKPRNRKKITQPGAYVLAAFAAVDISQRSVARAVGALPSTVCRWRERNGGLIPARYHQALLQLARESGAAVTAEHLVYGSEAQR